MTTDPWPRRSLATVGLTSAVSIKVAGEATVGPILLFVFAHIVRQAGLWIQGRIFSECFPTTYLVQWDEPFSDAFKAQYVDRVHQDFKIDLKEGGLSEKERTRRFDDAARLVLKRSGGASLVEKHNTWYGLYQNLIGGAYWGLACSIVNVALALTWLHDNLIMVCSQLLGCAYLALIASGRKLVTRHSEAFATQLLTTYGASNKN